NLDRLAENGARFLDFHSNGAVCSPTRAALVTGQYQQRIGIPSVVVAREDGPTHRDGIKPAHTTFAELLRTVGYRTGLFGKWHLGYYPKHNPTLHGFDRFRGYVSGNVDFFSHVDQAGRLDWWNGPELQDESGYTTHLITHHSLEFIEANKDHPFCLYVAHEAPHYPYQGPNDSAERVAGTVPKRVTGSRKQQKAAYREMVSELDKGVGQIVDQLDRFELSRKTLVFFFSDNGATKLGSCGPLRGNKGTIWEGGHRIPAIAYWPTTILPSVISETAVGMDLVPTMLSLADVPYAESDFDGISIASLLKTSTPLPSRSLFWDVGKGRSAVRHDHWKLVSVPDSAEPMLFDLSSDIGEKKNVASENPQVTQRMSESLADWRRDVGSE
ncbi:MAG: sulfatase-like hydrolase/transferase, partial [Planctomycetales bacterium]|nr:sulfatase-like hydrolase/transferase [Planctomycetales bacterium]